MQKVKCDLCGSEESIVIEAMGRFMLPLTNICCKNCGLVYLNPVMDSSEIAAFYSSSEYYSLSHGLTSDSEPQQLKPFDFKKRMFEFDRFMQIKNLISPNSRVLEIGCGGGYLLSYLNNYGCQVEGLEPSNALANLCKSKGIKGYNQLFEDADIQGSFDVIIMFHVLEHFLSPVTAMKKCRSLLNLKGKVIVEVPNVRHLWGNPLTGENYIFCQEHPVTFSENTLHLLALKTGFSINFLTSNNPIFIFAEMVMDSEPIENLNYGNLCDNPLEVAKHVFSYRASFKSKSPLYRKIIDRLASLIRYGLVKIMGVEKGGQLINLIRKTGAINILHRLRGPKA